MMEEPQLKKTSGRRKEKLRPPSHQTIPCPVSDGSDEVMIAVPVNVQDAQDRHDREDSKLSSESITYYTRLFLKVGLWIIYVWIWSHFHLSTCCLLPLAYWLYSGPMKNVASRARSLRAPAA